MIAQSFRVRLKAEIIHWQERNLIDPQVAERLTSDVERRHAGRSFSTVLAILGAILLSAATIAFVAANWAEMSRVLRLALLFGGLWASFVLAYITEVRGQAVLSEVCLITGTAIFGATIMLIGQMFHLQGDVRDALALWFAGAALLAIASRSVPTLVFATVISIAWLGVVGLDWARGNVRFDLYLYPFLWLVCTGIAVWLRSRLAAHGLVLAFMFWQGLVIIHHEANMASVLWLIVSVDFVIAAALLYSHQTQRWLAGFEAAALVYMQFSLNVAAIAFMGALLAGELPRKLATVSSLLWLSVAFALCGAFAVAARRRLRNPIRDHIVFTIAVGLMIIILGIHVLVVVPSIGIAAALYAFFVAIWTVRFGWRLESGALSSVGYLAFVVTLAVTYSALFGSLQMTAAVYGLGGVALVAFSIWLSRRERGAESGGKEI